MPLTPKQERFVNEYLIDLNATQAASRAGYSKKTANEQGARLLAKASVSAAIAARRAALRESTEITQERVLNEYAKLAFLDPRKFYDAAGNLVPVHKLDIDTAGALTGMDIDEIIVDGQVIGVTKKIKYADKKGALDSLAKHLGMFIDRTEVKATVDTIVTNRPQMTKEEWLAEHGLGSTTGPTD